MTRPEMWILAATGVWLALRLLDDAVERDYRRRRAQTLRALADSRCPRCSSVYGMAAAERAEDEHSVMHSAALRRAASRHRTVSVTVFWTVRCPHCGGAWEYDSYERKVCDRRYAKEDDPEADEIARRNGVHIPEPRIAPDPVPGAEWGEAVCSGCGARKRHWADHGKWACSRCGEPLGEAPATGAPESPAP